MRRWRELITKAAHRPLLWSPRIWGLYFVPCAHTSMIKKIRIRKVKKEKKVPLFVSSTGLPPLHRALIYIIAAIVVGKSTS